MQKKYKIKNNLNNPNILFITAVTAVQLYSKTYLL